jgi:tol-pal system protein YbgF
MKYIFSLAALFSAASVCMVHAQPAEVVDLTVSAPEVVVQEPISVTPTSSVQDASALIVEDSGPSSGDLYFQMQTLQREVMELRNIVELQTRQLNELRQLSLQRYIELDRRLASGATVVDTSEVGDVANNQTAAEEGDLAIEATTDTLSNKTDLEAYDEAYQLVKARQYQQSIPLFERFIAEYPTSVRQANAYYWLGALYMVVDQLPQAEQSLTELLTRYPDHAKIPDASYKLATLFYKQGKRDQSRQLLEEIVAKYANTNSNTVQLATTFLRDNF